MIIIKVTGGLGNQLFQYAFAKYIEKSLNINVKYDMQTILEATNFTKRNLDIEKFKVILPIACDRDVSFFLKFRTGILWRIERKFNQILQRLNSKYLVQKNAHSLDIPIKDNAYYDGYWQCYQYVDEVRDLILQEIKAPESFYKKQQNLLSQMQNSNSVAIHVRRDDYINIKVNALLFEVCDLDYYNEAITVISKNLENPHFFIFSQDEQWVKDNFIGDKFHFIKGNSAIDDILLMSHCKHNIIANSTFSWWGAWLNPFKEKIVIAPKKWYIGKRNEATVDLIPPDWIRI
ncbi:alpha-1,2-fucosyltransferase [Flavobacterium faecale]|uniref:alpha-1,2-fucosyltransferase n=1 Tax=Flavobacterium faecale TaxID=1355330 RepID=UPI003AAC8B37